MAEWKETHRVESTSGNGGGSAAPWLAFLVGALLVAVIAVFLVNAHVTANGPAGHIDLNTKSTATAPAPAAPSPQR